MGLLGQVERVLLGFRGRVPRNRLHTENVGAAKTLVFGDSGTVFRTTAAVNFTLPAVSGNAGWHCWIVKGAANDVTITSAEGDNIDGHENAAADTVLLDTVTDTYQGSGMHVILVQTLWYVLPMLYQERITITAEYPVVAG